MKNRFDNTDDNGLDIFLDLEKCTPCTEVQAAAISSQGGTRQTEAEAVKHTTGAEEIERLFHQRPEDFVLPESLIQRIDQWNGLVDQKHPLRPYLRALLKQDIYRILGSQNWDIQRLNVVIDTLDKVNNLGEVLSNLGQGGPVPEGDRDNATHPLEAAIAMVPKDVSYGEQASQLEGLISDLRQRSAVRLLPALKDEMRRRDHGTYDQKIELVAWVNAELRRFDMAFKNPKTGEAAAFRAKSQEASHPEIGHFQLVGRDAEGREKSFMTPDLETLLDKLELMDAPARREALSEWQATVGRQRRGAKRG